VVNGWCRWSSCSARGQQERDGEPEPVDLEVHRVRIAVPGPAERSERRVVPHVEPVGPCEARGVRAPVEQFEPLAVPQVEPGLVGPCEVLDARKRVGHFEGPVEPPCERVAAAECVPPVVPRCRVARWGPRHGWRRLVQLRVYLRRVAELREHGRQDWAARQAAFARGSVQRARLVAAVSRAEGLVRPERLRGAARVRDRQWAAGGPLPAFVDGRDSPRQIVHDWLRPSAYVEPAQGPALCAAHAVPPVRQAWVER
jgi:hypothetical protein